MTMNTVRDVKNIVV